MKLINELKELFEQISGPLFKIWHFPIFPVGANTITVANIAVGLILIAVGYVLAKRITRFITRKLFLKLQLGKAQQANLEAVIFYTTLCFTTLFAMSMANIPLTTFTLLGGALAIGFGFGSQNVVNNFISGLILMIEKPVSVGDVVEIDGLVGTIEHIGPRSTRLRTARRTHIVIPNSSFLEKNVVNWTLIDNTIVTNVRIGVAYNSDIKLVQEVILQSLLSQSEILPEPPPRVLLVDFADSAIVFEAIFALQLGGSVDRPELESNVRIKTASLFKQHGIEMPFPQRDIHLDFNKKLQVEMLNTKT